MKRILFASILSVSVIALTLNSCKKTEPDTETQSAVDNSICEGEFTSRMPIVHGFAIKENGVKSMLDARSGSCPSVNISPADTLDGFPVTMVLDYGTGCVDSIDHKVRKGQMYATFSKSWDSVGAVVTVKLVNYYVGSLKYTCDSIMITRSSLTSFTNQIIGGKCIDPSWSLSWAATRTLTQTAGFTTPFNPYDDVFSLTGSANGTNRDGKTYSVNITSPIVKRATCSWIESGKIDITPQGLSARTVDYGTGTCDSQATLTINGNTFTFTMN